MGTNTMFHMQVSTIALLFAIHATTALPVITNPPPLNASYATGNSNSSMYAMVHASETIEIDLQGMGVAAPQAGLGFSFTDGTQMPPAYNTHDAEKMLRPPPETSYDQEFQRTVISSASDYSKSVSASAEMQASGWGASVQSKLTTSSKTTGSESLINFVAHSYVIASAPTMMDACPKLTKTASNILKHHGETAFKMAFGSHFIYGYRAAASAMSEVMIKESSSSKRSSLVASLSASFSGFGAKASGSASFANAVSEHAQNEDISISLTVHGVTSHPSSQNISALGDYVFNLPDVRDTTIRSRAVLRPHSYCPEYQKIIESPLVPPPVAAGNDALLDAWAMIRYDQRSYDSIAESSAALLKALVAGKYQARIDAINSPISKLIMSNASSELISPTALQSIRDAKTKALTIGFELSAIHDEVSFGAGRFFAWDSIKAHVLKSNEALNTPEGCMTACQGDPHCTAWELCQPLSNSCGGCYTIADWWDAPAGNSTWIGRWAGLNLLRY